MDWTNATEKDIIRFCQKFVAEQDRQAKEITRLSDGQAAQAREITRLSLEFDILSKEQARQAKAIAKHEELIRKSIFKLSQAKEDIEYLNDYCNNLYQLLDIEKLTQAGTVPGSKTDIKCQKKIITLTNQIHSAEARLAKAKYAKAESERILAES